MAAVDNRASGGVHSRRIENKISRYRLSRTIPFPNQFFKLNNESIKIVGFT